MKKKLISILILIAISMMLFNINIVCATTQSSTIDTGNFKPPALTDSDYKVAFNKASTIVHTITIIGIVVSVVGIIGLGIKYMAGSVEEKAEYKKTMIPMLIGMVFIFASSTIVSIIYSLASQL